MSSNGQVLAGKSPIATNAGTVVQVPDLNVPTNRIYNFVTQYRKDYFEDHSLDWCLDEIISRGIAEITRQVKTAKKVAVDKASGSLLKEFNLSPADAKKLLLDMLAKQKAEAEALKAKADGTTATAKAS